MMINKNEPPPVMAPPSKDDLKQRLRSFWDAHNPYWDLLASDASVDSSTRARAAEFIAEGSSVIDVGCGNAANSHVLKKRGCRYLGMDVSLLGLGSSIDRSLMLVCGDADCAPFADHTFDAAFCTFVLEHSVNPLHLLHEMCRVVRPGGRIVLLGPSWDLPFWYPNAIRSKVADLGWRTKYTMKRFAHQMAGWLLGALPFDTVDDPDVFHCEWTHDSDAVYIVWTYEVIRQMRRWHCHLVHWEVDERLLGARPEVRLFKRLLMMLPLYRYAGSTVLLVFERC